MSYKTYTYKALLADPMPLTDGLAALFNNSTNPCITLEINNISILPSGGQNTATSANALDLYRITDLSTGTDSETITPLKHDTNSSDLPSQVLCIANPLSATTTDLIRQKLELANYSITTANASQAAMMYGLNNAYKTLNTSGLLHFFTDTNLENIILREGEGFALFQSAFGLAHSMTINVIIRNISSGATYTIRSKGCGTARILSKPIFGILNGSGSGVTLSLQIFQIPSEGEATSISTNRLVMIEGYDGGDDISSSITAHDTAFAVPSFVKGIAGPFTAYPIGKSTTNNYFWNITHGTNANEASIASQQQYGRLRSTVLIPWGTNQGSSMLTGNYYYNYYNHNKQKSSMDPIILRAQQGIALVSGRAGTIDSSTYNYKEVFITFTIIDESASNQGVIYAI